MPRALAPPQADVTQNGIDRAKLLRVDRVEKLHRLRAEVDEVRSRRGRGVFDLFHGVRGIARYRAHDVLPFPDSLDDCDSALVQKASHGAAGPRGRYAPPRVRTATPVPVL